MFTKSFYIKSIIVLNIFFWVVRLIPYRSEYLQITFLDVGQGDSIYLTTPDGYNLLIDSGRGNRVEYKLAELYSYPKPSIDYLFLSHFDGDHIEGAYGVLKYFNVRNIVINDSQKTNPTVQAIMDLAKGLQINIIPMSTNNTLSAGCCVDIEILWPDFPDPELDENDISLAMIINFGSFSMYTAGDLGRQYEIDSLKNYQDGVDLLKISHHGSNTSTSPELIDKLDPSAAVIQVGADNKYGHPTENVLNMLENVDVWRNDLHGNISVSVDNELMHVLSAKTLEKKSYKL